MRHEDVSMRDHLTARLTALRQEEAKALALAQQLAAQIRTLEQQRADTQALLWRLAGAIQVLEETLALPDAPAPPDAAAGGL
jgi:hypothetical protein